MTASVTESNAPSAALMAVQVTPASRLYSADRMVEPSVVVSSTVAVTVAEDPTVTGLGATATAEVIGLLGLTPVMVDVEPGTFNVNAEIVEAAITERTKAIVPVHLFGQRSIYVLVWLPNHFHSTSISCEPERYRKSLRSGPPGGETAPAP